MRFNVGKVPSNPDFNPELDQWRRLKEPGESTFFTLATIIGIASAVACNALLRFISNMNGSAASIVIKAGDLNGRMIWNVTLGVLVGFACLIIVHELVHLLAHPHTGRSKHSILGFIPKRFSFYAFYGAELSRNRFLFMVSLPFLLISVLPMLAFSIIGPPPFWLGLVVVVNALISGGDLVAFGIVAFQLPRKALIRHQSWDAYWKKLE